jgi:hypothetical protein
MRSGLRIWSVYVDEQWLCNKNSGHQNVDFASTGLAAKFSLT